MANMTEFECPACKAVLSQPNGVAPKFCSECGAKIETAATNGTETAPDASAGASANAGVKDANKLWIAAGKEPVYLLSKMVNRHGLVAGATGTGKTVSIKVLAEAFSDIGVPVFMADIKGDVSGLCRTGEPNPKVEERVQSMNIPDFSYCSYPVRFFDVYGKNGIPVRATISAMGPLLIARILGLNETQTGILQIVFKIADDKGLPLIDLKDLRAMVQYAGDNVKELSTTYGNFTSQSTGTIQRGLLTLETNGGDIFFGEPALEMRDWMGCDESGRGFINIMDCVTLFQNPMMYSTLLMWMLTSLYEIMPESGDLDKPKIVFFFDEAHILFNDAPKVLLQKIEQVVRLIRSKGVGIYFITQSPADIPDTVLSQLGNKIQHALRAYTPKDQRAVKAAAASFRSNPDFSSEKVLGELSTGEALLSVLDEKGAPHIVQRGFMLPPRSFIGPAEPHQISELTRNSPLYSKYGQAVDRESAYEILQKQNKQKPAPQKKPAAPKKKANTNLAKRAASSAASQVGRTVGKALIDSLLGKR